MRRARVSGSVLASAVGRSGTSTLFGVHMPFRETSTLFNVLFRGKSTWFGPDSLFHEKSTCFDLDALFRRCRRSCLTELL